METVDEDESNPKSSYFRFYSSPSLPDIPGVMKAQELSEKTYRQRYDYTGELKTVGKRVHDGYHVIVMET